MNDASRPSPPLFDDQGFQEWSLAWCARHLDEIEAFRCGLATLTHRVVILCRTQGKTRRAAAARWLLEFLAPDIVARRARRDEWRRTINARAPGHDIGGEAATRDLVWMDIQNREITRRFPDHLGKGNAPPPVMIERLIITAARAIPMTPPNGAIGCQTAGDLAGLLRHLGHPHAGVVAAALAVHFNPRAAAAHRHLAAALAAIRPDPQIPPGLDDPDTRAMATHRALGIALEWC